MNPTDIDRIAEKLAAMEQCYPYPWEWCWIAMDPWRMAFALALCVGIATMVACFVAVWISWRWR